MDAAKKHAYRHLIYQGMLWIRPLAGVGYRWSERWSLAYWLRERSRIRRAGEIADWLHNLALFSALDFEGFDEGVFWSELDRLTELFPSEEMAAFHCIFLRAVSDFNDGR